MKKLKQKLTKDKFTMTPQGLSTLKIVKIEKDVAEIKELVESIFDKISDIYYKRNE